jgi:hypothetical protein
VHRRWVIAMAKAVDSSTPTAMRPAERLASAAPLRRAALVDQLRHADRLALDFERDLNNPELAPFACPPDGRVRELDEDRSCFLQNQLPQRADLQVSALFPRAHLLEVRRLDGSGGLLDRALSDRPSSLSTP